MTNEWISVSERLPEEDGRYLVVVESHKGGTVTDIDRFDTDNQKWVFFNKNTLPKVVYWQPLPKPPEGE